METQQWSAVIFFAWSLGGSGHSRLEKSLTIFLPSEVAILCSASCEKTAPSARTFSQDVQGCCITCHHTCRKTVRWLYCCPCCAYGESPDHHIAQRVSWRAVYFMQSSRTKLEWGGSGYGWQKCYNWKSLARLWLRWLGIWVAFIVLFFACIIICMKS